MARTGSLMAAAVVLLMLAGVWTAAAQAATWSVGSAPASSANAVTCVSPTMCVAVGEKMGPGSMAETWDGTRWRPQDTPGQDSELLIDRLQGVACWNAVGCVAVGGGGIGNYFLPLIDIWDGEHWAAQQPARKRYSRAQFAAVSCFAPAACVAVGTEHGDAIFQRSVGGQWRVQRPPAGDPLPSGVSCVAGPVCVAVGADGKRDGWHTGAARWTGGRWIRQRTPSPRSSLLQSVSCSSARDCFAVGRWNIQSETNVRALVVHWDGRRWSRVKVPVARGTSLDAVSCSNAENCVAVGSRYVPGRTHKTDRLFAVIERWDGGSWHGEAAPAEARRARLTGVSCVNDGPCMAVGTAPSGPVALLSGD